MKIAQVSPLYESVPPCWYGGTERVVAHLTDALTELGHDVTLFATADSRTKAELVPVRDRAIRLDPSRLTSDCAAHLTMLKEVYARRYEFDIIHFHIDLIHFPLFQDIAERTVTTLHGRLDLKDLPGVYRSWRRYPLVSISDRQRAPLPDANWVGTVHHGVPPDLFPFWIRPSADYFAFLGRIAPEKRPDRAIEIARRAGVPLKIAAKVDNNDVDYFNHVIRPMLDGGLVEFIGEIGDKEKAEFLGNAKALLFPIDWPEPFGLVMIEAMACGTPVIAWDCGSVPEVVDDGTTGFIVRSMEEAVAAAQRVGALKRRLIRETYERRFTARTMARKYVDIYTRVSQRGTADVDAVVGLP